MAGNIDKVREALNSPDFIVEGAKSELLVLKHYPETNITETLTCTVELYPLQ